MSAFQALKAARDAGVRIFLDGDALALDADTAPPATVLDLLSRHKAGVVALLRAGNDGWSGEDWRGLFDERAGIAEFDGGLPRESAEARAFACCVAEWLNRNPVRSSPGRCKAAALANANATGCCRPAPNRPAMLGCIPAARKHGGQAGSPRRSPPFQPLRSA